MVDSLLSIFIQACKLAIRECIEADIKREKELAENPDQVSLKGEKKRRNIKLTNCFVVC